MGAAEQEILNSLSVISRSRLFYSGSIGLGIPPLVTYYFDDKRSHTKTNNKLRQK